MHYGEVMPVNVTVRRYHIETAQQTSIKFGSGKLCFGPYWTDTIPTLYAAQMKVYSFSQETAYSTKNWYMT